MTYIDDWLAVASERTGTTVRVIASGELDLATVPKLREHTDRCLADHSEIIVLDLSDISFIDSTGIQAVVEIARRAPDRVRIIASPACVRVLEVVGLADQLPLVNP